MEMKGRELGIAEATFVNEYLQNGNNASAAYRAAFETTGISDDAIRARASYLLTKSHVAAAVEAGKAKLAEAVQAGMDDAAQQVRKALAVGGISLERTLLELARMGYANLGDMVNEDWSLKHRSELSEDDVRGLAGVEITTSTDEGGTETKRVKVKLDKLGSLDKLMRHLGGYEKDNEQVGKSIALAFQVSPKDEQKSAA